jgi:prolyl-tRNA synthetase
MKLSKGYWQSIKEIPNDAEIISHQLLIRAGFINKTSGGIYTYLPMAVRTIKKIEKVVREELDKIGCHEITMSVVTPGELWKETGRWDAMGPLMLRFKDRAERDLCMSPTNEETVTDLFRKTVTSYKQLPVSLYQINTKFRDEIRPRFGLMRAREFIMKDAYSFHVDKACMDKVYEDYYRAYSNIFNRLGLKFIAVEADGGAIAGQGARTHEFQVIADAGEDVIAEAEDIGYAANLEKAVTYKSNLKFAPSSNYEEIATPNKQTCEEVSKFLNIPIEQTLKTLVVTATYGQKEAHYFVLLIGDDNLNEVKIKNHLKADHIQPANDRVLAQIEVPKGYMSPMGKNLKVLVDSSIDINAGYVVGANHDGFHAKGFTVTRDLKNYVQVDLRLAKEGDLAHDKKSIIKLRKGIEVGHIFQLGDKYSKSMQVTVLDQNAKRITPLMGCYGIGVSRVMAAAIEQNHDQDGIIWPNEMTPYDVFLGFIGKKDETLKLANNIYENLKMYGLEVLFDDRNAGPGTMFKDADLLGFPIRVIIGERDFEKDGLVEIKTRKSKELVKVPLAEVAVTVKKLLENT